jgi:hypothetical protein
MELIVMSLGGVLTVLFLELSDFVRHRRALRQVGERVWRPLFADAEAQAPTHPQLGRSSALRKKTGTPLARHVRTAVS